MVVYPLNNSEHSDHEHKRVRGASSGQGVTTLVSAWQAVERKQKQHAEAWWLVAQPDHAGLSGDLAANICCPCFPKLDEKVIEAITLHDAGWAQFDGAHEISSDTSLTTRLDKANNRARPVSFLDVSPADFLFAWGDSILRAEESSAIGGILVSQHFSRLAQHRLRTAGDSLHDVKSLETFVKSEAERQHRLTSQSGYSEEQVCTLVDVLQFCDLLSLYLCCGAREDVEFPQKFQDRAVQLRVDEEMCRLEPAIFGGGVSLGVSARRYPMTDSEPNLTTLAFLLA
jgi:hypothetical protein